MQKKWRIKKHDHERAAQFGSLLGVPPLVAALLIDRGHDTEEKAGAFLRPNLSHLHDPLLLKSMETAAERIERAIRGGEKILIWGDYDVDGTTGTTLLRKALGILGGVSSYHIPNRFTEGYGLNIPALEAAKETGTTLVITVDCGIRSFEPLEWAAENGLDVIVTDHHLSDVERGNPHAFAVINPNQAGCTYPDKELAGVGVAFKLAHELLRRAGREGLVPSFLKIAAIGTVADVVKLTGENRSIVALGLRDLRNTRNLGLKALIDVADCSMEMTSTDIGFRIAPRINAAGRMDVAKHVVELFESETRERADQLAHLLNSKNRERQGIQASVTDMALLEALDSSGDPFVVVAGEGWHRGVIGLAASRVAERLCRPAIVLSTENGLAHGSARTFGDIHLINALDSCRDLFIQYGGHAAAAGMQVLTENIPNVRQRLNEYLADLHREIEPTLEIDARVSTATLLSGLVEKVAMLEPFGAGNPRPVFATNGLRVAEEARVMKEKHLKFILADDAGRGFEAVWWDGVRKIDGRTFDPGERIEIAYRAETNLWQGQKRLQLVVEDLKTDN